MEERNDIVIYKSKDGLVFQDLQQHQTRVVIERLQDEVIKDDEVISLDMIDDLKKTSIIAFSFFKFL